MSVSSGPNVSYSSGYTIHTFLESGTFTPNFTGTVEVLVVAGGGGGGMDMGGGGGGGGVISNTAYAVTAGTPITVTVGLGGKGGPAATTGTSPIFGQPATHQYLISATNGENSVFGTITAVGGGFGGSSVYSYTPNYGQAGSGGSGGGASGYNNNGTSPGTLYGYGTAGQGNNGGGCGTAYYSGGGGGAGSPGISGNNVPHGGDGVLNSILGPAYYWGAGGGGSAYSAGSGGNGGKGGGGGGAVGSGGSGGTGGINPGKNGTAGSNNAWANVPGGDAGAHTGSGGGGGSHFNATNQGGAGGSGIVVVKYLSSLGASGGSNSSGLIFSIDAGNPRSYLPSSGSQVSLIDTSSWTVSNGAIGIYGDNNSAANESQRIYDTDPWGNSNIVWGTYPSGDGGADGGWNSTYFAADRSKLYRFSMWVRRTSSTTGGTFYWGLHTNGTGDVYELAGGASQTNPYWDIRGPASLAQNQWYLVVGHIFPAGWGGTTAHPNSGLYTIALGAGSKYTSIVGNISNDCRFPGDATQLLTRSYHYYCGDTTSRLQFYSPRIDLCDGSEPSIDQLLNLGGYNTLVDIVGGLKNNILNRPILTHRKGLTFDGTNYIDIPSNTLINGNIPFTIEAWFYTTTAGRVIFGNYGTGYTSNTIWFFNGGLYINGGSGTSYFSDYSTRCVGLHHLVSTRDASGNCVTYLDGGNSGIVSGVNNPAVAIGVNFRIGADVVSAGEAWIGDIYSIKIYNRALSASEVKQSFNAQRGRYGP